MRTSVWCGCELRASAAIAWRPKGTSNLGDV
jgi:hypothetical protein